MIERIALQGTIPKDVDLLPGQVAHIRELISRSVADFPAPPTYRSPAAAEAEGPRESRHHTAYHPGHGGPEGLRHRADEVDVVYELSNRQRMLSQGMLEKEMPRVLVPQLQSFHRHGHSSSSPSDPPPSVGLFAFDRSSARRQHGVSIGREDATESRLRRAAVNGRPSQQTTRSPPLRQEDWSYVNKNPNQASYFIIVHLK